MGFYRIHMLEVITLEFLIVPLILVIGGIFTLLTAVFGFYVTFRYMSYNLNMHCVL